MKALSKRRQKKVYSGVCACGCGQAFTSPYPKRFLNPSHANKILNKGKNYPSRVGKNNPNYKHGLLCKDPLTGIQLFRGQYMKKYDVVPLVCQNPNCPLPDRIFYRRKTVARVQRFCSLRCWGLVHVPKGKKIGT